MSEETKILIDYLQKFVIDDRKEITKYGVEISQDSTKLLLNYIEQLRQENKHLKNILTEFEKWLIKTYYLYVPDISQNSTVKRIYDKLQELKGDKK